MIPSFSIMCIALVVGVASGLVGAFIILKRMALVGDALSHVALPGVALALGYGLDPFWGVVLFLLGAAVAVWWLEAKTRLPTEALVGLLFTASLAIGILLLPDTEIIESLFGGFSSFSFPALVLFSAAGVCATTLLLFFSRRFLFSVAAPELSTLQYKGRIHELILLLAFAFIVALGIKLVGTLLMGALTIIPASIAKNMSASSAQYLTASALLGGAIALGGVVIAGYLGALPGPTIILFGIGIFGASLLLSWRQ